MLAAEFALWLSKISLMSCSEQTEKLVVKPHAVVNKQQLLCQRQRGTHQ